MEYTKHLSEPWFSLVSLKLKTVEGRLNNKVFKEMKPGDTIYFIMMILVSKEQLLH